MEDRWLSVDEIAEYLGVPKDAVYAWVAAKGLPGDKVGGFWKLNRVAVDSWAKSGIVSEREERKEGEPN